MFKYCLFFYITTPSLLKYGRLYSVEIQGLWWIIRYCATSRAVAGLIPVGITGVFHCYILSGRMMTLKSSQSLREMSTRNISWVFRDDSFTPFMCRFSWNLGVSTSWNPPSLSMPGQVLLYLYIYGELFILVTFYLLFWTSNAKWSALLILWFIEYINRIRGLLPYCYVKHGKLCVQHTLALLTAK